MSDVFPPERVEEPSSGVPKDHVRRIRNDEIDAITDAELVEDDEEVARDAQHARVDAAAVAGHSGRAGAVLAEVLDDDLDIVAELDGDGELNAVLTIIGGMTPVAAPAAPAPTVPLGEVEIECPGCGLAVVGTDPRPTASWFCPRCDYPLFLVRRPAASEPSGATRGARRRLPGTAGRTLIAAGACWNCGEWNEAGVTVCLRCTATLPRPEAPKVPAEVIPPELEPELVEVEVMYWPPTLISAFGGFGAGMVFVWAVLTALGRL